MKQLTPFAVTFFVLILVTAFVVFQVFNSKLKQVSDADTAEIQVTAVLGQKVNGWKIFVTPVRVIEDSRCATDAVCAQSGTVRLLATITTNMDEKDYVLLLDVPVNVKNGSITLIRVAPEPLSQYQILASQYRFTFKILEKG